MEDALSHKTLSKFKPLLGQRVVVETEDGEVFVGLLEYVGRNKLHGKLQVTLSRMPVWPVKQESIKIFNK
jgi:hypothetical protein